MKAWSLSNKIGASSAAIALLGFVLVIWQVGMAARQMEQAQLHQRAQLLAELHQRGFGSPANAEIFQKIEYGRLDTASEFHHSDDQKKLVQLLSFLELVARLERLGLVAFSDIEELYGYYIARVYSNPAVEEYRAFLKGRVEHGGYPPDIAFPGFEQLAERVIASSRGESAD